MNRKESVLVQQYAQSFVDLLNEENVWDIYEEVKALIGVIEESKLNRILLSSTVSQEEKEVFLQTIRRSENHRVIHQLMEWLLQDGRIDLLLDVLQAVVSEISRQKNEFTAHIVSVYPLTAEQKERLRGIVEAQFHLRVRSFTESIDKELLGGFIVTANHRVIDASVRKQLEEIKKQL